MSQYGKSSEIITIHCNLQQAMFLGRYFSQNHRRNNYSTHLNRENCNVPNICLNYVDGCAPWSGSKFPTVVFRNSCFRSMRHQVRPLQSLYQNIPLCFLAWLKRHKLSPGWYSTIQIHFVSAYSRFEYSKQLKSSFNSTVSTVGLISSVSRLAPTCRPSATQETRIGRQL